MAVQGYVYKSVAITSANTGNANMKFRELGGKPITLSAPWKTGWTGWTPEDVE